MPRQKLQKIAYASISAAHQQQHLARIAVFVSSSMKTLTRLLGATAIISAAALSGIGSSAQAATFDFITGVNVNTTVKTFLDSGVTLEALNSNSTGNNPGTINAPGSPPLQGLCAWATIAGSTGRCGYGTATGSGISSFQLKFDKAVAINSFNVSAFDAISAASIGFSLDNVNFTTINLTGTGNVTLASLFTAGANQTVFVRTTGTTSGSIGGVLRLGSLTAIEQTPAPLPILGAAVAFRASRRMRKRICSTTLNA